MSNKEFVVGLVVGNVVGHTIAFLLIVSTFKVYDWWKAR